MNPNDLAWKGTTPEQKRELFEHLKAECARLINEGKSKDGRLGLASTCVDIIRTAKAGMKDVDERMDADVHRQWQNLLEEALTASKEALDTALKESISTGNIGDWAPSDFEVAGAIMLEISEGDLAKVAKARGILEMGIQSAVASKNFPAHALLCGQMVRASMAVKDPTSVRAYVSILVDSIADAGELDSKVLTRVFRAVAEGAKFLSIHYAEEGGLENQVMKALNI